MSMGDPAQTCAEYVATKLTDWSAAGEVPPLGPDTVTKIANLAGGWVGALKETVVQAAQMQIRAQGGAQDVRVFEQWFCAALATVGVPYEKPARKARVPGTDQVLELPAYGGFCIEVSDQVAQAYANDRILAFLCVEARPGEGKAIVRSRIQPDLQDDKAVEAWARLAQIEAYEMHQRAQRAEAGETLETEEPAEGEEGAKVYRPSRWNNNGGGDDGAA